jgi:hypothetical protein
MCVVTIAIRVVLISYRHFCYLCGKSIIRSALGREIDAALQVHYRNECILFEVPD